MMHKLCTGDFMKFIVSKSSDWGNHPHLPPVDGAVELVTTLYKDIRTFKSIDEWKKKFPCDFKRTFLECGGCGESVYMTVIRGESHWIVEIQDIYEFVRAHKQVILRPPPPEYPELSELFEIEIYNCRRE